MKILAFYLLSALLSVNGSCNGADSTIIVAVKPVPVPHCFIYCDFTRSMNSAAHSKVIRDAMEIYDSLSATHRLHFFTIGNSSLRAPVWETKYLSGAGSEGFLTDPERNAIKARMKKNRAELMNGLLKAEASDSSTKTCIVQNIKQSIQDLLNLSETGDGVFKLLFLSDMLENCNGIRIQSGDYTQALKALSKMQVTDSFSKFRNLTIAAVISYSKEDTDSDSLVNFWRAVFLKFGYTGPAVRPSASIPWQKLR